MSEFDEQIETLDRTRETVVYCHLGMRSADAVRRLRAAGFTRVAHLEGGIDRYSVEVDASVPRY
jgi:rhodanese-related sulfurtransferase